MKPPSKNPSSATTTPLGAARGPLRAIQTFRVPAFRARYRPSAAGRYPSDRQGSIAAIQRAWARAKAAVGRENRIRALTVRDPTGWARRSRQGPAP
jgi:hypothetical protein